MAAKRVFFVGTGIFLVGNAAVRLCRLGRDADPVPGDPGLRLRRDPADCDDRDRRCLHPRPSGPGCRAGRRRCSASPRSSGRRSAPFLVQHVHWAVVFWINLPIGVLAIAMFAIFLPETAQRRRHSLDYLGGILLMIGVGALMLALVQARTLGMVQVVALAALGIVSLAWLFAHERRTPEPMLPLAMWRRRVVALCNARGLWRLGRDDGGIGAVADLCARGHGTQSGGRRIGHQRAIGELDVRRLCRRPADDPHLVPADSGDRRQPRWRRGR